MAQPEPRNAFAVLMASSRHVVGSSTTRQGKGSSRGTPGHSQSNSRPASQHTELSSQHASQGLQPMVSVSRASSHQLSAQSDSLYDRSEAPDQLPAKRQHSLQCEADAAVSAQSDGDLEEAQQQLGSQPSLVQESLKLPLAPIFNKQKGPNAGLRKQDFDIFLVYDLEATTNRSRTVAPIEIIEVSCVAVCAHTLNTLGEWQGYVRPTEHPRLDPFCIELTGITQQQVDASPLLVDVLLSHERWLLQQGLLVAGKKVLPVTWTSWDMMICMEQECNFRKLPRPPYMRAWCNLKAVFSAQFKATGNLRKCVEIAGLTWQGRAHSGLDDSRNTAALLCVMLRKGAVLKVTERFEDAPCDHMQGLLTKILATHGSAAVANLSGALLNESSQQQACLHGSGQLVGASQQLNGTGVLLDSLHGAGNGKLQAITSGIGSGINPTASRGDGSMRSTGGHGSEDGVHVQGSGQPRGGRAGSGVAGLEKDASGRWTGKCRCGVKAHLRTTKKPGANHGRSFYACGSWRITAQGRACSLFLWADELGPNALPVS